MAVTLKATELEVIVNGTKIGTIYECGGFWRATLTNRRRRFSLMKRDYDTRAKAVRAVVAEAAR